MTTTTASGLQIADTVAGTGATPKTGQTCVMHYTGWLYKDGARGSKFDSSVDRGQPFEFTIGVGQVIKGWDEGVASMKVGGKRSLIIRRSSATAHAAQVVPFLRTPPSFSMSSCSASRAEQQLSSIAGRLSLLGMNTGSSCARTADFRNASAPLAFDHQARPTKRGFFVCGP